MNDDLINFIQEVKNFEPTGTQKARLENVVSGLNKFLDECNTVVFLCTHNSRRSQYCEIWSKYFSSMYKNKINFFSAGVVKTTVHKQIYKSLERVGIGVDKNLSINTETISISPFSKTLSEIEEKTNPNQPVLEMKQTPNLEVKETKKIVINPIARGLGMLAGLVASVVAKKKSEKK